MCGAVELDLRLERVDLGDAAAHGDGGSGVVRARACACGEALAGEVAQVGLVHGRGRVVVEGLVGEGPEVTRVIAVDRIRSMRDNGGACTHEYGQVPSVVAL